MLNAERPAACRAFAVRSQPRDLVALILYLVVQLEQLCTTRARILLFPNPGPQLFLGNRVGSLEPLGEGADGRRRFCQ